ncbi:hypothetical protein [Kocuria palustris]|uniref:hypothetical protein n=1 Tax=Kocuria palustris TaxID=71999 RepID=UPI003CF91C15
MIPLSPAEALGSHASGVRDVLVEVVHSVHGRFAEAHLVSESRYAIDFGSQWRDLLADANEALVDRGFQSHKLRPAGYKLPVVNDCLIYVWRIPDSADPGDFASSPTKKNGFSAQPPDPTLFDPVIGDEPVEPEQPGLERVVRAAGEVMPVVLAIVHSSPRQLQSIEWAVAELDETTGKVKRHGQEAMWEPELVEADAASAGESFDSGTPVPPGIEPREQEGIDPDA